MENIIQAKDAEIEEKQRKIEIFEMIVEKHKEQEDNLKSEMERLIQIINGMEEEMKTVKKTNKKLTRAMDIGGFQKKASFKLNLMRDDEEEEEEGDEYVNRKIREEKVEQDAMELLMEEYEGKLLDKQKQINYLKIKVSEQENGEDNKFMGETFSVFKEEKLKFVNGKSTQTAAIHLAESDLETNENQILKMKQCVSGFEFEKKIWKEVVQIFQEKIEQEIREHTMFLNKLNSKLKDNNFFEMSQRQVEGTNYSQNHNSFFKIKNFIEEVVAHSYLNIKFILSWYIYF